MHLKHIYVNNLRNIKSLNVDLSSRITLVTGNNGQGKTSILEAVYIASWGKSFRAKRLADVQSSDSGNHSLDIHANVLGGDGPKDIRFSFSASGKVVEVNGNRVQAASNFLGQFVVFCFSSLDQELVMGAPAIRRQYLDRVLCLLEPEYLEHLVFYQRALRSKAVLLVNGAPRKDIQVWNELMSGYAERIVWFRSKWIQILDMVFRENYRVIANHSSSEKSYLGYSSCCLDIQGSPQSQTDICARMDESIKRDQSLRRSTVGPHLDDLNICLEQEGKHGVVARKCASQGQSRTVALGLKIAMVELVNRETDDMPVFLLDDVDSELDHFRERSLYSKLKELNCQALISSTCLTETLRQEIPDIDILNIKKGEISR